jgi:SAM-dependent methyltransferase
MYATAAEENKRAIEAMMLPRPGGTLLDVGCADGSDAIRRGRGVGVRQVDITERWPLADASLDVVHSSGVIEHRAYSDHFMREIRWVVKDDGDAPASTHDLPSWHNIALVQRRVPVG